MAFRSAASLMSACLADATTVVESWHYSDRQPPDQKPLQAANDQPSTEWMTKLRAVMAEVMNLIKQLDESTRQSAPATVQPLRVALHLLGEAGTALEAGVTTDDVAKARSSSPIVVQPRNLQQRQREMVRNAFLARVQKLRPLADATISMTCGRA